MSDLSPLPPALILEELSRLIDSDALRRAPSHARLLRYLVENRVAGDETAFRETSIALEDIAARPPKKPMPPSALSGAPSDCFLRLGERAQCSPRPVYVLCRPTHA